MHAPHFLPSKHRNNKTATLLGWSFKKKELLKPSSTGLPQEGAHHSTALPAA
jgi:hypothetical protein